MSWPRIATGKPGSIASKVYSRVRGGKQQQHYHQQRGDQRLDHHQHQPARQSDRRRGRGGGLGGGGLQHNLADYIHDKGKFRSLDTLSPPSSTSEGSLGSVTTNHYVPFHPRAGSSHHQQQEQQEQPHAWSESSSGHLAHNTRPQKGSNINTLRSSSSYHPTL